MSQSSTKADVDASVLDELGLTPDRAVDLGGRERGRLLHFLVRWEHVGPLHACLDALIPARPRLVSLLDFRARALLAQDRPDDALEVMQERLRIRTSPRARALLARAHLARGDREAAQGIARGLVEEREESATAWSLSGEVALARGDAEAALEAYRHLRERWPNSRAYLMGMVDVYRADEDWVTASGYAVRLLRIAEAGRPLPVSYVRRLCDYFRASGEETRVAELEAELERRQAAELAELREDLSSPSRSRPSRPSRPARRRPRPAPARPPSPGAPAEGAAEPAEPPFTFDRVPVSDAERARIAEAAGRLFGFEKMLPGQLEAIACVLRGEDVLVVLPTGGGKSLCYQLPALLAERGTTLVISPLIALMKDQVDSLPARLRCRATAINSSLDRDELRHRLDHVADGAYRLVYAAPERMRQPPFLHALRRAGVDRLVIDEAHCVSVWGHDFRPDYLSIGRARRALGGPPLLAMTATAPTRVRRDVLHHLGDMRVIAGDVTRPNLRLEVLRARGKDDKLHHLLAFCRETEGSGIVYAGTRARCERLAGLLRRYGVEARHYHAGISNRAEVQDDFMAGRFRVAVATIAFGLGIDKPDIRFIVHFVPSESLEAYYQEAGRAGRDGLPARCLLMYAPSDRATLTRHARQDVLPVEFLRRVYGAVKRRLGGAPAGRVTMADLERDLRADGTRVRVGLSLLEEVGLLRRGPDLPRSAEVCVADVGPLSGHPDGLAALCRAARLRPGQSLAVDLADVARRAGLPLDGAERRLLEWAEAGRLDYRPAGRDLLLEIPPPPDDAAERIAALLERYEAIQIQRGDEITAYARTGRCRHGHINAYLGGRAIERCEACDNCVEVPAPADPGLPSERDQLLTILRCAAGGPWSWGRRTLVRILRGDAGAGRSRGPLHAQARGQAAFGALAFRSGTAIGRMLDRLEEGGFLRSRRLDHGGEVLDLTPAGKAALKDPAALEGLVR